VGLRGSVTDTDGLERVDRHDRTINYGDDELNGNERCRHHWQRWRMGQSETAFVRPASLLPARGTRVLNIGEAHRCPQRGRNRSTIARQCRASERVQEVESHREQRSGERGFTPTGHGLSPIHSKVQAATDQTLKSSRRAQCRDLQPLNLAMSGSLLPDHDTPA
jgi:hypothetical protein